MTGDVEAHQYNGAPESARTIAEALGLTIIQHHPRAAVYTVPDRLAFSPGDYYDVENREIAILAGAWIWVNHDRAVLGCEWDEYFRGNFVERDVPAASGMGQAELPYAVQDQ